MEDDFSEVSVVEGELEVLCRSDLCLVNPMLTTSSKVEVARLARDLSSSLESGMEVLEDGVS